MDILQCGFFTVCWCAFSVTAEVHREIKAVAGNDVLLDCQSLQNDVTLLEWIRPDLKTDGYVFFYREKRSYENYQHPDFRGRVKLGDPQMEKGNMSVLLTNVQPDTDNGTYLCYVSGRTKGRGRTTSSEMKQNITLTVSPAKLGKTEKQISNGGNKVGGDMDGGDKDGGDKDGGDKDGGDKDGGNMVGGDKVGISMDGNNRSRNGLIVFWSLSAPMAFLVFIVIRKEQKKNSTPPVEQQLNRHESVSEHHQNQVQLVSV